MEKVTESLAGQAVYVDLLPMTMGESAGITVPSNFQALWQENFRFEQVAPLDMNLS